MLKSAKSTSEPMHPAFVTVLSRQASRLEPKLWCCTMVENVVQAGQSVQCSVMSRKPSDSKAMLSACCDCTCFRRSRAVHLFLNETLTGTMFRHGPATFSSPDELELRPLTTLPKTTSGQAEILASVRLHADLTMAAGVIPLDMSARQLMVCETVEVRNLGLAGC